jgi:hypothetical protein
MKGIVRFFDKLEDRIRIRLSRYPIIYALVGAVGIVLVWKGVWETAEYYPVLYGPSSIILGLLILLATGLLVSFFVGDSIILSGFRQEKKLADKTAAEVAAEGDRVEKVMSELRHIERDLEVIKKEIGEEEPVK